jgi:hypothetical protein
VELILVLKVRMIETGGNGCLKRGEILIVGGVEAFLSSSANLNEVVLKPSFLFDLPTEAGETYRLTWTN